MKKAMIYSWQPISKLKLIFLSEEFDFFERDITLCGELALEKAKDPL
jgi:hypothetical protein